MSLCSFCFRLSFIGCKSQYHSQPLAWTFFTNHFFTGYEDKLLWTLMLLGKIKRLVIYYSSTCSGGNSKNESPYDNLWDLLHEPRSTNLILCLLVTCKRFIQGSKVKTKVGRYVNEQRSCKVQWVTSDLNGGILTMTRK